MQKSYIKNYIQTYIWQSIAVILNLASMFIVIPLITNNAVIYGIYSVCISTALFLKYADIGFIRAGLKYAGESYARGDHTNEMKMYGFSSFILFIFICLIASGYLIFAYSPSFLIKDVSKAAHLSIASSLLLIQAVFSFNTVLQRYVTGVFQVRIEQYVYQRLTIIGSVIKISSVYYFFGSGKYDIVGYFLFTKTIDFLGGLVGVWVIQIKYKLFAIDFIKAFHFDREVYLKTKNLAFSSLVVTLTWIIYFELDLIVIGKWLGATSVAIFALAFTFMKFLRSMSSIVFSPFQNRYNHLIGQNNIIGFKELLNKVMLFAMPIFVLPVISISILHENIVLTWAGSNYAQSGLILAILVMTFMYNFITIPGANMFVALERIKEMYLLNIIMVIVYWLGIYLTVPQLGLLSFAVFRVVAGTFAMLFYLVTILHFLDRTVLEFLKNSILQLIIPICVQVIFLVLVQDLLPITKSKINLLSVIGLGVVGTLIGLISLLVISKVYRTMLHQVYIKSWTKE
ncbi:MAG: hypothetical protein K9N35_01445 [Candidatus Marinimicrobia bacterium]|nr:hypothetical protein [Candidatus Neomarinimicrobiota bacterium]